MELRIREIPTLRNADEILSDQAVERIYTQGIDYDWWRRDQTGDLILYQRCWYNDSRHEAGGYWGQRCAVILVHGSYYKITENYTTAELLEQERIEREEEARAERLRQDHDRTVAEVEKLQDAVDLRAHRYCKECLVDMTVAEHIPTCSVGILLRKGEKLLDDHDDKLNTMGLVDEPIHIDGGEIDPTAIFVQVDNTYFTCTECRSHLVVGDEHEETCSWWQVKVSPGETRMEARDRRIAMMRGQSSSLTGLDAVADAKNLTNEELFGPDSVISPSVEVPVVHAEPDGTVEKTHVLVVSLPEPIIDVPTTAEVEQLEKVLDHLVATDESVKASEPTEEDLAKRVAERNRKYRELGDTGHNRFEEVQAGKADFETGSL